MRTFVATKNAGKLAEIQAIFADSLLEIESYPEYADVREGETDYIENALLKARALRAQLKTAGIQGAVLADDSGLEVDHLQGRPGVLSARYAGENATWSERRQTLLEELKEAVQEKRDATFVSAIAFIDEDGNETTSVGTLEGSIAFEERGTAGFGYDQIFIPEKDTRTFAQYSFEEKNNISHRRAAAKKLLGHFAED